MGMVTAQAKETWAWVGWGTCFRRWDLGKARKTRRKHSAGLERDHPRPTASEHEGDWEGPVWKMCGRAGRRRGASFALRILGNPLITRKEKTHLHGGSRGATTFSSHLGGNWEVRVTVGRRNATWQRAASPRCSRWADHSLGVLFRSSLCALARRFLGESDGAGCSRGSSVVQET